MRYQIILFFIFLCIGASIQNLYHGNRISDGWKAKPHQFPYHIFISIHLGHGHWSWCGGAIIHKYWVLSAAHCFGATEYLSRRIIAGYTDYKHPEKTGGVSVDIEDVFMYKADHPGNSDFALVKLKDPIYESDTVKYAELPSKDDVFSGKTGVISGHGKTSDDVNRPADNLMYTELKIEDTCDWKNYICASEIYQGSGTCKGDSGGPLLLNGTNTVIGTLFGGKHGCGIDDKVSYFNDVQKYLDWIAATTGFDNSE